MTLSLEAENLDNDHVGTYNKFGVLVLGPSDFSTLLLQVIS